MEDGKQLWSIWQRLLSWFGPIFTRPGLVRFFQWASGTVLCDEQHTITQEVTSLGLIDQWRNWEHFAEYGAIDLRSVEQATMSLIEKEHPCRFGHYHPVAVDDTKELRASTKVWGVCTYKHQSRNAKHPKLVMAHNWVIMGDLAPGTGQEPWTYLPTASRLYMRKLQLPAGEVFRTKNELAVEMLEQVNQASEAAVLAIVDGGYARKKVVRPCLGITSSNSNTATAQSASKSSPGRRIEILTRPRKDARLYRPLVQETQAKGKTKPKRGGRPRIWGERLPAPKNHAQWNVPWVQGHAWAYGKLRNFRCKSIDCRWSVSGPNVAVRVWVFEVEGYAEPWFIVTSALDLSAAEVLEAYAARFRQEDAIRDHKQRLGMEEVRAWTKAPILRTFMMQQLCMTLLRLLQWQWAQSRGEGWCPPPPWNKNKTRVSILDLRRLFWRHRKLFSHFLQEMDEVEKLKPAAA